MHRRKFIAEKVIENDWRHGVELGVAKGLTYLYLLEHCPELYMLGVDLWKPNGYYRGIANDGTSWSADNHKTNERMVRFLAQEFRDRSTIWKMSTLKAAEDIPDETFDFVFIDADHSYSGVIADIEAWRSKIRPGGMLIGHDIDWQTVRRAVKQLCPNYEKGPDNLWYITI